MKKTNIEQGSALVFALMVMFIVLTAALGVASVSVIEQKNSSDAGKSAQSFQVADSAVELVLKKAALNADTNLYGFEGTTCLGGEVDLSNALGKPVKVTFQDSLGGLITSCDAKLNEVSSVKAVATYSNTTRAISAAVAAGTLNWTGLSFTTGVWSSFGSGWTSGQYAKDSRTGIVYLRGLLKANADFAAFDGTTLDNNGPCGATTRYKGNSNIATLPVEHRPLNLSRFEVACWPNNGITHGSCMVDVYPCGEVWIFNMYGVSFLGNVSLDGIYFTTN